MLVSKRVELRVEHELTAQQHFVEVFLPTAKLVYVAIIVT